MKGLSDIKTLHLTSTQLIAQLKIYSEVGRALVCRLDERGARESTKLRLEDYLEVPSISQ